ncbi:MAG: Na/Pi cotransporter family protein [Bacteroidota bacterium]|nr:Na/Pi cotransporter family protein [Bacteroidota bacterium]
MNFGIFEILKLLGALGFFIYGMKIMSDGIQKLAGAQMRKIISSITNNKFAGVLTGFFTTSIIQSSSATTVMVVSFVNAGLLTLRQAIGVIMGANIGTTVTAFMLLAFGFGKFSISDYSLPLIGIGIPLYFTSKNTLKSLGEFLIGFAILFMGLDELKDLMSFIKEDPLLLRSIIDPVSGFGFFSVIIFVLIGTVLTVVVQSSSAAMAITLALCGGVNGIPFELAAAIILGENIGTTITANIAATIGNVHAKRAARAHLFFNIIGVIWMLIIFFSFLDIVDYLLKETFFSKLVIQGDDESLTRWSLAVFHLLFNIINTFLLIWFIKNIEKAVIKLISSKGEDDEIHQLKYFSNNNLSNEFSIVEVKNELQKFVKITAKMNTFTQQLILETDRKKINKLLQKLEQYEEITDRIENEVSEFLSKVNDSDLSSKSSEEIRSILTIISELENIGDVYYSISKNLERKIENKLYFIPSQRNNLLKMISIVEKLFSTLDDIMNNMSNKNEKLIENSYLLENELNKLHYKLKKDHLKSIEKKEYKIKSGILYADLLASLEMVGNHITEITDNIADTLS